MWDVVLPIENESETPLFLQIAQGIISSIKGGRLQPGDRLPGSRSLAEQLKVHRNTVLSSYEELASQGWLHFEQARGTFVSKELPDHRSGFSIAKPSQLSDTLGFPLQGNVEGRDYADFPSNLLALNGGIPELEQLPFAEFHRAYRRVIKKKGKTLLNYGSPHGYLPLREALVRMLSLRRGLALNEEQIVLTRGSQMALYLIAQALVRPGDVVGVESFGYQPAWQAFRMAGAHLQPIPVDEHGLRIDILENTLKRMKIRALYITPHHQFPTQVTLSVGRRMRLLELAKEHSFAVIEDDYDHEFHYDGRPVLPLASMDSQGVVVYVGTLSKVLAPGLRLGYAVAPRPLIQELIHLRRYIDRQGSHSEEAVLAELFEEGQVERHIRRMRRVYRERREHFHDAIQTHLPEILSYSLPRGGLAIWAKVSENIDLGLWQKHCIQNGVSYICGVEYAFDRQPIPFVRMGFAHYQPSLLVEAVLRMKAALEQM